MSSQSLQLQIKHISYQDEQLLKLPTGMYPDLKLIIIAIESI